MTPETLRDCTGCRIQAAWIHAPTISKAMADWGIGTALAQAGFVANAAHESALFESMTEVMDYHAQRILAVWPARFWLPGVSVGEQGNRLDARQFEHQPEKLANAVYANRLGNGSPASGDGWTYRGRGFGLTGRDNYMRAMIGTHAPVLTNPDLASDPAIAADVFGWFWQTISGNALAASHD